MHFDGKFKLHVAFDKKETQIKLVKGEMAKAKAKEKEKAKAKANKKGTNFFHFFFAVCV